MQMQKELKRGDIYIVNLPDAKGSIQGGGKRPMIIISNNLSCRYSPVIHAIPLTGQTKRWIPTHVEISANESNLIKNSIALVEQIQLLPKEIFETKIGFCSDYIVDKLDRAIKIQFALIENKNNIAYA